MIGRHCINQTSDVPHVVITLANRFHTWTWCRRISLLTSYPANHPTIHHTCFSKPYNLSPNIHVSLIQKYFGCRCLSVEDQVLIIIITTPRIREGFEKITPQLLVQQNPAELMSFSVGRMLKQCLHCCALRFISKPTNCCHNTMTKFHHHLLS